MPCIIEESLDSSRKESNELKLSHKEAAQSVSNPFRSSIDQESSGKETPALSNFTKKPESEKDIPDSKHQPDVKKSSKEGSSQAKPSLVPEEVRSRANAKNTSFDNEKSVIEETVREFENFEIGVDKDVVDVIKNSKEDHKDIQIKMKFENQKMHEETELLNQMAMEAIARITKKFQGKDFENSGSLNAYGYKAQVERLIKEASDPFNLCQSYSGWNPFL